MDQKLYTQILQDLGSIDYAESVCFAGWCEPFSQPSFLERVKEAWDSLPCALLLANSNTDFLSPEVIHDAAAAGLSVLKAQLYFGKDEYCCDEAVWEKMENLRRRLPGIDFEQKPGAPGKWFAYVDNKLVIVAYAKDFRKVGHNRCDTMIRKPEKRYHTCGEAITMFGVNHNGWAVPCCNIRSDYPPHQDVLLGKMDDTPGKMFELYQGALLQEDQYPCSECMGKQWHACHKLVFAEVFESLAREERAKL